MEPDRGDVPDADLAQQFNSTEDKADILAQVVSTIEGDGLASGREILNRKYPFAPVAKTTRNYTERQCLRLFYRDGFIDRYSGTKLVNPGALKLLSVLFPEDFPAHSNWLMAQSHFAFWELFPTVDHLEPVARGGADAESNWVSTSMLRNSAKAHWTVAELGWALHPPGDHTQWDGLTGWFVGHLQDHPDLLSNAYLARWYRASLDVRSQLV